jgi:transposase
MVRLLTDKCPDQIKLPFFLWTREAVQQLLAERFGGPGLGVDGGPLPAPVGLHAAQTLAPRLRTGSASGPTLVGHRIPAIRARARAEGAEIHWGDEMGLRSDHQAGRSWGKRGKTPVVPATGQRFGCNMISTVTHQGTLSFMVFPGRFTARVFLAFLRRLVRQRKRTIFLIVDRHSVHRAAQTRRWLARHEHQIRLFFLPAYSPELNPDELLNHDVKANAIGRKRAASLDDLVIHLRGYLRSTQRQPAVVQRYFRKPQVQYAAA